MDNNREHLVDLGLKAVLPAYQCWPLQRTWCDALWAAHMALGNWSLLYDEEREEREVQP